VLHLPQIVVEDVEVQQECWSGKVLNSHAVRIASRTAGQAKSLMNSWFIS
jgi:hypothetical protein